MFDSYVGVGVTSVLAQAAEGTYELVVFRRCKHASTVILLATQLALDSRVMHEIRSSTSADAPGTICPILVDVLTKDELGATTLLHSDRCRLTGKDTVQTCKIQSVRNFGER